MAVPLAHISLSEKCGVSIRSDCCFLIVVLFMVFSIISQGKGRQVFCGRTAEEISPPAVFICFDDANIQRLRPVSLDATDISFIFFINR